MLCVELLTPIVLRIKRWNDRRVRREGGRERAGDNGRMENEGMKIDCMHAKFKLQVKIKLRTL